MTSAALLPDSVERTGTKTVHLRKDGQHSLPLTAA